MLRWGNGTQVINRSFNSNRVALTDRRLLRIPLAALLLLAVMSSTFVFSPPPVSASVGCGATITTSTTLAANIGPCSGNGLVIGHNGITLNCNGHTITGTATNTHAGIYLSGKTGVTVKNCKVTAFRYGIELLSSSRNTLSGNTANGNHYDGFYLSNSFHNILTKNTADSNYNGFYFVFSSDNTFTANTASGNTKYNYYERC
jgi:parallel beta-helix repeat protein